MDSWHAEHMDKPAFASEAIICFSERGNDVDFCPAVNPNGANPSMGNCTFVNEVSNCTAEFLLPSETRAFMAGTYLWSGFDYAVDGGEGGPMKSTATGMVADKAGFEKPIRWFLRSWWLSNVSASDASRVVLWPEVNESVDHTTYIVDSWTAPPHGSSTRSVHVYTNAPFVRLWVNGKQVDKGKPLVQVSFWEEATFPAVLFEAGNLTAGGVDASGARVGTPFSTFTSGKAARIVLTLDSPSPRTGTGNALVADGQDTAMVRAEVVSMPSHAHTEHAR